MIKNYTLYFLGPSRISWHFIMPFVERQLLCKGGSKNYALLNNCRVIYKREEILKEH